MSTTYETLSLGLQSDFSWVPDTFASIVPFLHKNVKIYILLLSWYKDDHINIMY